MEIDHKILLFLLTLDKHTQKLIFEDLTNKVKKHHWMWYGFPSKKNNRKDISENTKKYSLTISETKMFLLNDILLRYYKKALSLLKKYHYTLDSLKLYFSDIDYRKFISHIKLFHRVINELLYTLGDENNKLVRSLKSVEKNIDYFYRVVNKL